MYFESGFPAPYGWSPDYETYCSLVLNADMVLWRRSLALLRALMADGDDDLPVELGDAAALDGCEARELIAGVNLGRQIARARRKGPR